MATRDIPKQKNRQELEPSSLEELYPGNSYAQKDRQKNEVLEVKADIIEDSDISADKPKVRQVGKGKVRKQSLLKKFARYIFEDTVESAKEKALEEVIKPGLQSLIFDTGTELLSLLIFGSSGEPSRGHRSRFGGRKSEKTSYGKYYDEKNRRKAQRESYRDVPKDPDEIIMDTRSEARDALIELDMAIQKFGQASIADFYDIVGVTGEWTDNRYGWTSLRGARVRPVRDGFIIELPPTEILD